MRAPAFVMAAAQSDQFEIREGQMAASMGDAEVRRFGEMMVRDHTKTSAALMAAAKQAGLPPMPPPPPRADQQQMMAQLENLKGAEFDRVYLTQQVASHRQALALMTSYERTGEVPALRAAAREALPIVREHLAMAEKMMRPS